MRSDDQRLTDIVDSLDWIAKVIADKTVQDFLAAAVREKIVAIRDDVF